MLNVLSNPKALQTGVKALSLGVSLLSSYVNGRVDKQMKEKEDRELKKYIDALVSARVKEAEKNIYKDLYQSKK